MYILVKQDQSTVYPYSFHQLRTDNPNTSFPQEVSDELYNNWSVFRVEPTVRPEYDSNTQRIIESSPILESGSWKQSWTIEQLSSSKIAEIAAGIQEDTNRRHRGYLASTDWYIIRKTETGIDVPQEILENRAVARSSISNIYNY